MTCGDPARNLSRLPGAPAAFPLSASRYSARTHAVAVSGQGTRESTRLACGFDGDTRTMEGWYDTVLDISWLANANCANTSGYATDGYMCIKT